MWNIIKATAIIGGFLGVCLLSHLHRTDDAIALGVGVIIITIAAATTDILTKLDEK